MKSPQRQLLDEIRRSGLSQSEVARRANISRPNLNRYLNGHDDITTSVWERAMRAARRSRLRKRSTSHPFG